MIAYDHAELTSLRNNSRSQNGWLYVGLVLGVFTYSFYDRIWESLGPNSSLPKYRHVLALCTVDAILRRTRLWKWKEFNR